MDRQLIGLENQSGKQVWAVSRLSRKEMGRIRRERHFVLI